MTDVFSILEAGAAAVFGAGVAYATMQAKIRAANINAQAAIQQADTSLKKNYELEIRIVKVAGDLERHVAIVETREQERRSQVSQAWLDERMQAQDAFLEAIARKTGSMPTMTAVRRPEIPRQDSDPPQVPPVRARLPSRRDP